MDSIFFGLLIAIAVASFVFAPRAIDINGFFKGLGEQGRAPGILALTFSQVTTWIFARSLMTAAVLGYYYGIIGGLAYCAYYLSFLSGGAIIRSLRFRHGATSVQEFLHGRFGRGGVVCYNIVIAVRLLSEVFANLLVIGIIFGDSGSTTYIMAIVVLAGATLGYSMLGGLRASLRTDVFQMVAFLAMFAVVLGFLFSTDLWSWQQVIQSSPMDEKAPGWILLVVAGLQFWSYPLHDPVMMDRGFIADRRTTMASFAHATWISIICIFGFSLLGVFAGLNAEGGEAMMSALSRMLGPVALMFVNLALIISAASTLDSTLSSAAKLSIADLGIFPVTLKNGRIAMALFMLGGLLFLFGGTKDLYSAVAVSGTASMYLAPVIFFSLWMGKENIPTGSYYLSFVTALGGAVLYYLEAGGMVEILTPLTGLEHKYSKLLVISASIMVLGNGYFMIGMIAGRDSHAPVIKKG